MHHVKADLHFFRVFFFFICFNNAAKKGEKHVERVFYSYYSRANFSQKKKKLISPAHEYEMCENKRVPDSMTHFFFFFLSFSLQVHSHFNSSHKKKITGTKRNNKLDDLKTWNGMNSSSFLYFHFIFHINVQNCLFFLFFSCFIRNNRIIESSWCMMPHRTGRGEFSWTSLC